MVIPIEIVLLGAGQLVVVTAAFIAVKTDTKWIKARLRSGDQRLRAHGKTLSQHGSCIAVLKSRCQEHHGTQFLEIPVIDNGEGDTSDDE